MRCVTRSPDVRSGPAIVLSQGAARRSDSTRGCDLENQLNRRSGDGSRFYSCSGACSRIRWPLARAPSRANSPLRRGSQASARVHSRANLSFGPKPARISTTGFCGWALPPQSSWELNLRLAGRARIPSTMRFAGASEPGHNPGGNGRVRPATSCSAWLRAWCRSSRSARPS